VFIGKLVCEVGEEGYTHIKKKYNEFWLKVVSHIFFCVLPWFLGCKKKVHIFV
jgi:hypothetical protein